MVTVNPPSIPLYPLSMTSTPSTVNNNAMPVHPSGLPPLHHHGDGHSSYGGGRGGGGDSETFIFISDEDTVEDALLKPVASGPGLHPPYQGGDVQYWDWHNGSLQLNLTVLGDGVGAGVGTGGNAEHFNWGILLLAPLVVFGIAGNTLVILAISLERRLQNVTNYFLLSLAVTDLLVSLIVMPFSIINKFTGRWLFGLILCNLFVTADVLMCTSSILHLCTISLERYVGIRYPLWAKNKSKRTVFFKIVLVWTLALAITSPITVLGMVSRSNIFQQGQCFLANTHFIIYGSIFAFFIPLTIMVVMYALTVRMLNKQAQLCGGGSSNDDGGGSSEGGSGAAGGSGRRGRGRGGRNGGGRERKGSQPVIRRSTSRKHWQRQTRHTVLGAPGTTYRKEPLIGTHSYPLGPGAGCYHQRYQPLPAKRNNTLPMYHDREQSTPRETGEAADDEVVEFCQENGQGSQQRLDNGSSSSSSNNTTTNWRRFLPHQRLGGGECPQCPETEEEPKSLKELVRKHHVAVKAANILLMRKDLVRKQSSSVQTEQKASKVLGVVFMIFVVCWAPFFLVNILTVLCPHCFLSPTLFTVFVWLGYVSSTLNPIIYTVFNKVFKLTFLKLLCCKYSHLHRGRRRSHNNHHNQNHHHTPMSMIIARNGSARPTPRTPLITCHTFCKNGGACNNSVEETMC